MKGVFLYYNEINNPKNGVEKKVISQIECLNLHKLNCNIEVLNRKNGLFKKVLYRLPFGGSLCSWNYKESYYSTDYIYFRKPTCITNEVISMLKKVKQNIPSIKIIMEIPTYPYDDELLIRLRDVPLLLKDRYNRIKLHGIVDRIATLTDDEFIFGVPTIKFMNGINIDKIKPKTPTAHNGDIINLGAVASMNPWHGYERMIKGLGEYYKNDRTRKVLFHLVGDGCALEGYKKLVKILNLTEYVIFHGVLSGQELDLVYDEIDLGVDVLGSNARKTAFSSSLKSREYLAKGLPVISGPPVDVFEKAQEYKYYCKFPNNSSPIDISKIISFYDKIYNSNESYQEIIMNIRCFAYETCDISVAMKPVIDYIKGGE